MNLSRSIRAGIRGCKGGLIATVLLTLYRLPIFRALPPTAEFWAHYVGDGEAADHPIPGFVLHLGYGVAAGGIFGPVFVAVSNRFPDQREPLGVVCGAGYGLVLSLVGSRVIFRRVLDRGLEPDHALVFHVGHLVYGLSLGSWVASGSTYDDLELG